jgi:hypothetical protein
VRITVGPPNAAARSARFVLDGFVVQESEAGDVLGALWGVVPWIALGVSLIGLAGLAWRLRR